MFFMMVFCLEFGIINYVDPMLLKGKKLF